MLNVKRSWVALAISVLAMGAAQAAQAPPVSKGRPAAVKPHKVVHSPYARAAAAHASAPAPGNPIKGHSVNMVQGQGMSSQRRHTVGKPH